MIALLCSVPFEAEAVRAAMTVEESLALGGKTCIRGRMSAREVSLCAGGMGKANAAHAATLLITKYKPGAIIIFGIGGAYPSSGARVGDLALASEEIYGDEGVATTEGFRDTEYIGIPLVLNDRGASFNRFPAQKRRLTIAQRSLALSEKFSAVHTGRFLTLSTCTGASPRAHELCALYDALCENMEGAAAAQVADLHGIPWIEVRGISNIVEDRDLKKWDIPRAAQAAQNAVMQILEDWSE